MQIRPAQIGVNQEHPAVLLTCQSMRQVIGHERFTLARKRTGHQDAPQWLLIANLIEPGPQGPELFPNRGRRGRIAKHVSLEVQTPAGIRALRPNVVKAQKLSGPSSRISLRMSQRVQQFRWSDGLRIDNIVVALQVLGPLCYLGAHLWDYWRR